ncbi:Listeria/Bacterioides repeat protein [Thermoplasmatales archaeon BRNA1]|nr:Listeria/Bacterioides repeat protein [Thermoplasmatales archaeon BRNA1]
MNNSSDSVADGYTHEVTYYRNQNANDNVTVTVSYEGIIATEYNPAYWKGTFTGDFSDSGVKLATNWTPPSGTYRYDGKNVTLSKVFAGWSTVRTPSNASQIYDPGDVIPSSIDCLYAFWVFPDTWGNGNTRNATVSYDSDKTRHAGESSVYDFIDPMYVRQYHFSGNVSLGNITFKTGTYRTYAAYSNPNSFSPIELTIGGKISLGGNAIVDNVVLKSKSDPQFSNNHGNDTRYGFFACGHKLIMGSGLTSSNMTLNDMTITGPQVYGGGPEDITQAAVTGKEIVSGYYTSESQDQSSLYGLTVNLGTFVIIHSGVYANVIGGGSSTIGSSGNPLSTYLVLKGGTVLDTLCAGNVPLGKTIYGAAYASYDLAPVTARQGGTFLYIIGATTPGDTWSSAAVGHSEDYGVQIREAAAVVGGSTQAEVIGSTHVFLSGTASVWDAQGGGRSGTYSLTTFGYIEASGSAIVRHAMCGGLTDGKENATATRVIGTQVVATDGIRIGMLCGAGFDVWRLPSMLMYESKSIDVIVDGGTIGFVYGGGFRGTVGSPGNDLDINVTISGGTVQYDVFGGGRGGLEKVVLKPDGSLYKHGKAYADTTGASVCYADINVTISGGTVNGDVYGGGESIAPLKTYKGEEFPASSIRTVVAEVYGTVTVTVGDGATVNGGVYGAGKGIKLDDSGNVIPSYVNAAGQVVESDYYSKVILATDSGFIFNDWFAKATSDDMTIEYYSLSDLAESAEDLGNPELVDCLLDYAKANNDCTVTVNGGSISHSVYGGGGMGLVSADTSVVINGGEIGGDVFGGGLGAPDRTSVSGNASVLVAGGTIHGSVYGGSAYGLVIGNIAVTINGGTVEGAVYGGGLGTLNSTSVRGNRNITLRGARISGSVYGGSSLGTDYGDSVLIVVSGNIGMSLYGGGFKGTTNGSSFIYVGYTDAGVSEYFGERLDLTIGQSVYGGGDIGQLGDGQQPFDPSKHIFTGNSTINICASYLNISFTGSIFGSGNSCIIDGTSSIQVKDLNLPARMESIHRANTVLIWSSTLSLSGRECSDGTNTRYSFYDIGSLSIRDGTTLYLYAQMEKILGYNSLGVDGNPSVSSSPSNRVVICDGTVFVIKSTGNSGVTYNNVTGYTTLSLMNTESYYGAYAIGGVASTGGFVIERQGSYTVADTMFSASCRCWFLSGTIQITQSVVTDANDGTASTFLTMPKVSQSTGVRFVSGYFAPNSSSYHLVDDIGGQGEGYFSVNVGSDDTEGYVTFDSASGVMVPQNINSSTCIDDAFSAYIQNPSQEYTTDLQAYIGLSVEGTTYGVNLYVGYVMVYFQEITMVDYTDSEGLTQHMVVVQNRCEAKIDIYTSGSALVDGKPNIKSTMDLEITTISGSGSTNVILPQGLVGYDVTVRSLSYTGSTFPISVASVKNDFSSVGWNSLLQRQYSSAAVGINESIGTTLGAYMATIQFSVSNLEGSEIKQCTFVMKVEKGGVYKEFTVNISVKVSDPIKITFYDRYDGGNHFSRDFTYGTVISGGDCPATSDNFVGWYQDSSFNNPYNFNTPLTAPITLYARYAFSVTFNNMNGTSSMVYIESEGTTLSTPRPDPTWVGYEFQGWYTTLDGNVKWNFSDDLIPGADTINGDVVIYAHWNGLPIKVRFQYDPNFGVGTRGTADLEVNDEVLIDTVLIGGTFGAADSHNDFIQYATDAMEALISESNNVNNVRFIRWQVWYDDAPVFQVYDDTEVPTNISSYLQAFPDGQAYLVLYADLQSTAITVIMDKNGCYIKGETDYSSSIEIVAPTVHLEYPVGNDPEDLHYTFFGNNATCSQGFRLIGWCTTHRVNDDGAVFVPIDTEWSLSTSLFDEEHNTLTLYAIWEEIDYTMNIVSPYGGAITVFDEHGARVVETTLTVHYGDTYTLSYAPGDSGYIFNNWYLNGEGSFDDAVGNPAVLTVTGNCAVYVQLTGTTNVSILVTLNGGTDDGLSISFAKGSEYNSLTYSGTQIVDDVTYSRYSVDTSVGVFGVTVRDGQGAYNNVGTVTVGSTGITSGQIVNIVTVDSSGVTGAQYLDTRIPTYLAYDGSFSFSVPAHYESAGLAATQGGSPVMTGSDALGYTVASAQKLAIIVVGTISPETYTVTYRVVGASGTFSFSNSEVVYPYITDVDYGDTASVMTVYAKDGNVYREVNVRAQLQPQDGFILMGWFTDVDHNNPVSWPVSIEGDTTLYAYIVVRDTFTYTIQIYQKNVGADTYALFDTREGAVSEGSKYAEFTALFEGFNYDHSLPANYTTVDAVDESTIRLYYVRATSSQTVTFSEAIQEGDVPAGWVRAGNGLSMSKTVEYQESLTLPVLSKTGYRQNWTVNGNAYAQATYVFSSVTLTGSTYSLDAIVIQSSFQINEYTLTLSTLRGSFPSNGASVVHISVEYNSVISAYVETPVATGYYVTGWKHAGVAFDVDSLMPAEDLELNAVWTPITYTVAFNSNGGSGSMAPIVATYDTPFNMPQCSFTYSGHDFVSWNGANDGSGTSFDAGQSVRNLTAVNGSTVNIYAIWEISIIVIAIPEAIDHIYDGQLQVGVAVGDGYDISGQNSQRDVGEYVAVVSLLDGYEWSDGTNADKNITWHISARHVYVIADSAVFANDGSTHTASGFTVIGLVPTHVLTATMTAGSRISDVGACSNVIDAVTIVDSESHNVAGNYTIHRVNGMLSVSEPIFSSVTVGVEPEDLGMGAVRTVVSAVEDNTAWVLLALALVSIPAAAIIRRRCF